VFDDLGVRDDWKDTKMGLDENIEDGMRRRREGDDDEKKEILSGRPVLGNFLIYSSFYHVIFVVVGFFSRCQRRELYIYIYIIISQDLSWVENINGFYVLVLVLVLDETYVQPTGSGEYGVIRITFELCIHFVKCQCHTQRGCAWVCLCLSLLCSFFLHVF